MFILHVFNVFFFLYILCHLPSLIIIEHSLTILFICFEIIHLNKYKSCILGSKDISIQMILITNKNEKSKKCH